MARKPSLRILKTKSGIKLIKSIYNDTGKVVKTLEELIPKI